MHSPLNFRSYLKPTTSPQVPKCTVVQNLGLFFIDLDVTQLIFHHIPIKKTSNVIFKIFSVIKIDKQSLNHKFCGFLLILSVPWDLLRTKCPYHNFFPSVWLFSHICFCWNTDISLNGHFGSDGFIPQLFHRITRVFLP